MDFVWTELKMEFIYSKIHLYILPEMMRRQDNPEYYESLCLTAAFCLFEKVRTLCTEICFIF